MAYSWAFESKWHGVGDKRYQTGVDRVALYVKKNGTYGGPKFWNGVTAINEAPSGAEPTKLYADNINYLTLTSKEEFGLTLECYCTPEAFDDCDGTTNLLNGSDATGMKIHGTARCEFGLVWRTLTGADNIDEPGAGKNFVYHIVYGCKASPSSRDNATVNDSPEAQNPSYEISTTPITDFGFSGTGTNPFTNIKELAHIEIDCSKLGDAALTALEAKLFTEATTSTTVSMPTPYELYQAVTTAEPT